MNSLWDIRIFLGLVLKESPCTWRDSFLSSRRLHNRVCSELSQQHLETPAFLKHQTAMAENLTSVWHKLSHSLDGCHWYHQPWCHRYRILHVIIWSWSSLSCSSTTFMRSAIFFDLMQYGLVIPYRRFGTSYRSYLKQSGSPRRNLKTLIRSDVGEVIAESITASPSL